jgi:phage shock protein A
MITKESILEFLTALKLTQKEIRSLEDEAAKWKGRVELALTGGKNELATDAEKELQKINMKLSGLQEEERSLKEEIDSSRRQLPVLAARERSIDTDLLEQELLMALGRDGKETETDRAFKKLEKECAADAALEALKCRMKRDTP